MEREPQLKRRTLLVSEGWHVTDAPEKPLPAIVERVDSNGRVIRVRVRDRRSRQSQPHPSKPSHQS